jgi:hypothetical protein
MPSRASIQEKVSRGFRIAGAKLGAPCQWYRAAGTGAAIAPATLQGTLLAAFDSDPAFASRKPSQYGKPQWYMLTDECGLQLGDYIVDPLLGTFFVASGEPFKPPMVIRCNRTLTFARPGAPPAGADYYGGDETATETPLLTGWPAAVLQGTKGEAGDTKLPGDTRMPWVQVLLPQPASVQLRASDIALDDQPIQQRYIVSSAELTALGYRLTATLALT